MSRIEDAVAKKLLLRAKVGEKKYGTTMEREDLSLSEWLNHLQEELLDAAVYVEKLKQEEAYHAFGPCSAHAFEEDDERMNIIGQNGNDGLHYDDEGVDVAVSDNKPCGWDNTRSAYPGDIEITYQWVTSTSDEKVKKQ